MPVLRSNAKGATKARQSRGVAATPNKHQAKTEETRRKLLAAARRVFAKDGFEAARLEDIAREAGHTRGAFYAHFSRKEDLFFALLEQQMYQHVHQIQTLVDAQVDMRDKLSVLRDCYVKRLDDPEWSLLMLEFKLFAARHKRLRARLAAAHREIRASLSVHKLDLSSTQGRLHPAFSMESIRVILESLLQALILQREYDPTQLSEDEAVIALAQVFNLLVDTA